MLLVTPFLISINLFLKGLNLNITPYRKKKENKLGDSVQELNITSEATAKFAYFWSTDKSTEICVHP